MSLGCGVGDVDVDASAVSGTDVGGDEGVCVRAFHMHFSVGILAGRRANLMAVEKGRRVTPLISESDSVSESGTCDAHRTPE